MAFERNFPGGLPHDAPGVNPRDPLLSLLAIAVQQAGGLIQVTEREMAEAQDLRHSLTIERCPSIFGWALHLGKATPLAGDGVLDAEMVPAAKSTLTAKPELS